MSNSKVTFGLVIIGLMLVYSNTVTSTNGQTSSSINRLDVFNGGKYSDPQNGIEVTFPDGWSGHKIISGNTTVIMVSKDSTGFSVPSISLEVVNKSFIQDMMNTFTKLAKNPVIAQKAKSFNPHCDVTNSTISVNGMGGFKMTLQCSGFPIKTEEVMFATDQKIIAMIYQANSTEFEKYGTDFDNTLNTLTISNALELFNPTILLSSSDHPTNTQTPTTSQPSSDQPTTTQTPSTYSTPNTSSSHYIIFTVSTDKSSYSPGDTVTATVHFSGTNEVHNIKVDIKDQAGNTIISKTVTTDSIGDASLQFNLPISTKSNSYQVVATSSYEGNNWGNSASFELQHDNSPLSTGSVHATEQQGNPNSQSTGLGFLDGIVKFFNDLFHR